MGFFGRAFNMAKSLGRKALNSILGGKNGAGTDVGRMIQQAYSNPMGFIKNTGRTAIDSLAEKGLNAVFDKGKAHASAFLDRKFPTLVKPFETGADALKSKLQNGYKDLLYGRQRDVGGGGNMQPNSLDSLTKIQ